jgi:hypothetical protein
VDEKRTIGLTIRSMSSGKDCSFNCRSSSSDSLGMATGRGIRDVDCRKNRMLERDQVMFGFRERFNNRVELSNIRIQAGPYDLYAFLSLLLTAP